MAALKRCGGLIARFSVKWSPVYFCFSLGLDAREPTSFPFAVIYKLIIILNDFAHAEWRLAGDKRSDGARLEPDGYKSATQQLHLSATSRYREWKDWSWVNWICNMLRFLQPFVGTRLKTTLMWINPVTASATIQQWLMDVVARVEHDSRRRLGHQLVRPTRWRKPNLFLSPCALLAYIKVRVLWGFFVVVG